MLLESVKSPAKVINVNITKTVKVCVKIYIEKIRTNWLMNIELIFRICFNMFSLSDRGVALRK